MNYSESQQWIALCCSKLVIESSQTKQLIAPFALEYMNRLFINTAIEVAVMKCRVN